MAQISYGTITITDTNDIERIYPVYCRGGESSAPALLPLTNWKENISEITVSGDYIWQRIVTKKSGINVTQNDYSDAVRLTGEEGDAALNISAVEIQYGSSANWSTSPSNWGNNTPAYDSTKPYYWTRTRLKYENNTYSSWVTNKDYALTDAIAKSVEANTNATMAQSIAQSANENSQGAMSQATTAQELVTHIDTLLGGHFIHGNALSTATPASARVIEQIKDGNTDVSETPSKWHHNAIIGANGISLRYNEAIMAQLAANQSSSTDTALKFYRPPTVNGNTTTQGTLAMELTSSNLNFYNTSGTLTSTFGNSINLASNGATITIGATGTNNSNVYITSSNLQLRRGTTANATLDRNGLVLSKGGIKAGASRTNNFIYLSSEPFADTITGHTAGTVVLDDYTNTDWRQLIGTKFGVRADGTLYASGAHIDGELSITGHTNTLANELSALQTDIENNLIYDHTYEINNTGDVINSITFTAHVYRSGVDVTSEFSDEAFTWYYKNENIIDKLPLNNNTNRTIQNSGKTITISTTSTVTLEDVLYYGAEIIGIFNTGTSQNLLDNEGNSLADSNNETLTGVTETGNSVRVRDLSLATTVNNSDKLLIVTPETEKIVNLSTILNLVPGSVTSVRVQATTPIQSSVSTAQTSTLNTTISLANGYGDIKNPYESKQAHYILAGPTTGSASPTFRSLVVEDVPDLSNIYIPIATASNILVSSITTVAGAHTTVTNRKGNISLNIPTKTSHLTNDSGFITSHTETDPIFSASPAATITTTDINNWNNIMTKANVQIIRWN